MDDFMYIKRMLIITTLFLWVPQTLAGNSWGYSSSLEKGTVYEGYVNSLPEQIFSRFPDIKQKDIREVADLSGAVDKYFDRDRSGDESEHFHWVTDGRYVLWRGQQVINSATTPAIDIASFRAYDRFAVDKYSIYFDGKRVASNSGHYQIDLATLKMNAGRNSTTLVDKKNLYLKGVPKGSAHDLTFLGEKSWSQRGIVEFDSQRLSSDVLIRFANKIYLNGEPLNADADSFQLVRWIPDSLLIYRDKNGITRYPFGRRAGKSETKDCNAFFTVGEDKVLWRKNRGDNCLMEPLPEIDPEQFHLLTANIAQYQDRLYVAKLSFFGEEQLEVITLDTPDLVIKSRLSAGKSHGYFLHEGGNVQIFETAGKLHVRDSEPDYDNRYVYTYNIYQLYRKASPCPAQSYFKADPRSDTPELILVDKCAK